jgi:hypothetical protein
LELVPPGQSPNRGAKRLRTSHERLFAYGRHPNTLHQWEAEGMAENVVTVAELAPGAERALGQDQVLLSVNDPGIRALQAAVLERLVQK